MPIEDSIKEFGNAAATFGKGLYNGVVDGLSTVARGAVDAGRQTLQAVTDLSSPDAENFLLFYLKAAGKGIMELGGSVVSGGINGLTTAAKSLPDTLGHVGSGIVKLATPDKSDDAVASAKLPKSTGIPSTGFIPDPTPGMSAKGRTVIS